MQVIVHGGAGGSPDEPGLRQAVLDDAAAEGAGSDAPLDAVETVVRVLESSERFNAGVGGSVQSDGGVRTDAGVMTDDREAGAVCSMAGVEHAVSAARVVMAETPHVLLAGEHAVELAADHGVETGVDLRTEETGERFAAADAPVDASAREQLAWVREQFGGAGPGGRTGDAPATPTDDRRDHDTVGAVARDGDRFAAATSTGGRWLALAGRVGDVPQIGSGFYCSPAGGASATGRGEDIARVTLSRRALAHVERGLDADAAADLAIEEFGELTGSSAGIVVLDRDGTAGSAYNSDAMQTAVARE